MKVIIVNDPQEGGKAGFKQFKDALANGARCFGLATGGTPQTTYEQLRNSDLDFSSCRSINLDEYVGLAPDNDQSYHYFMQQNLFNAKPFAHSDVPNGLASDIAAECQRYDQLIREHPIDFQLLGIGRNGHIAFNEPGSPVDGWTHEVKLTQSTIDANARFFANEDEVPRSALSMGIGAIMAGKKIMLEAYGENKADAVAATIEGPVTPDVPASILQKHPDVVMIIDKAAASKLQKQY
ncbi:glucosamine-6-phosphate deaminase [Limosilactobacillus difficilis]|uniref:glucosamine-6-phosphate deaminase n=1 Tax=Limosilactobacillus difficilis TaxID=2991838 RepID=UPI0024BA3305|nr:glucosamine-6-phosphate deaminase [Limosilactobacillus difficilis]